MASEPTLCRIEESESLLHGRIESRTCFIYDGAKLVADKAKWGESLIVIDIRTKSEKKSDGSVAKERKMYITNLDESATVLNAVTRRHWLIESMHWTLDTGMMQDLIKRKRAKAARNLDTTQRTALAIMSFWRSKRKKIKDRTLGYAEIMRKCAMNFTFLMKVLSMN